MANSPDLPIARTAGKNSVNKALELLRTKKLKKSTKRGLEYDGSKVEKIDIHCATVINNGKRKPSSSSGFLNGFALTEMRNAFNNQDWASIHEIFLLLLKCYHFEPIIWRYAFLIHFCSPASNIFEFQEFIEMCLGTKLVEDDHLLEALISLSVL